MGLEVELGKLQGDGATVREHLCRMWRNTRQLDPQLAAVREPLPTAVAYLWAWFVDLSGSRGAAGAPITCVEIEAWQRLLRVRLTPWEVDTLRAMDRAALAAWAAQSRNTTS